MKVQSFHDDGVQSVVITGATDEQARAAARRILVNAAYNERIMPGGSHIYTVLARKEQANADA